MLPGKTAVNIQYTSLQCNDVLIFHPLSQLVFHPSFIQNIGHILGGQLVFDEVDVQLNAKNILIVEDGLLQVSLKITFQVFMHITLKVI